ncbi:TPA: hypothetical protein ACP5AT_004578, partial [Escherichia coli]
SFGSAFWPSAANAGEVRAHSSAAVITVCFMMISSEGKQGANARWLFNVGDGLKDSDRHRRYR